MRGASAHGEGACHRAARRPPARHRRLPAAHGSGPRRTCSRDAPAVALRGEVRDRDRGSTPRSSSWARPRASRRRTTASLPSSCSTRRASRRSTTTSSNSCGSAPGTPRFGREIDDRVLPAEAGLDVRARRLREGVLPGPGADRAPALPRACESHASRSRDRGRRAAGLRRRARRYDGKVVGRVTSAVLEGDRVIGLGFVRVEVPRDATFALGGRAARHVRDDA